MSVNGIYMAGIWDMPLFQTVKNLAKYGLDAVKKNKTV